MNYEIPFADGKVTLHTTLSQGQVNKFNGLAKKIIVEGNSAYIPIKELHGVLLTNSRDKAAAIVDSNQYRDLVKPYLITDKILFQKYGIQSAIRPVGVYNLLEQLAIDRPGRATEYRASLALLTCIVAQYPQLVLNAAIAAKALDAKTKALITRLKTLHNICQLSGQEFAFKEEKHAHHIEGVSESPGLMATEDNIIIIKRWLHDDYHEWASKGEYPLNRISLRYYAKHKGYSVPLEIAA
jgi:hypothetical protein